jgi:hypothetical protein
MRASRRQRLRPKDTEYSSPRVPPSVSICPITGALRQQLDCETVPIGMDLAFRGRRPTLPLSFHGRSTSRKRMPAVWWPRLPTPTSHERPNWCCSNCGWVWRGKNPRGKLRELIDSICSLTLVTASLIGLIFGIAWLSHVIGVGM